VVQPGRARLFINKGTAQYAYAVSNDWMESDADSTFNIEDYSAGSTLTALA